MAFVPCLGANIFFFTRSPVARSNYVGKLNKKNLIVSLDIEINLCDLNVISVWLLNTQAVEVSIVFRVMKMTHLAPKVYICGLLSINLCIWGWFALKQDGETVQLVFIFTCNRSNINIKVKILIDLS